jgi:hypothetical protein
MNTKKTLTVLALIAGMTIAASGQTTTLLAFDFSGAQSNDSFNTQNSTANASNVSSSTMIRGAGISNQNAANSFRGTGFSNLGIDVSSDRYFEWTVSAASGYQLSIASIYANFNGTTTFSNSPGVTMAYAYSLDGGSNFTVMDSFTQVGSGNQTFTIAGAHVAALTDVESVVFKFLASGQTTTGGWGFQSAASPGTIGLSVDGTISPVPEPATYGAIFGVLALGMAFTRRRVRG